MVNEVMKFIENYDRKSARQLSRKPHVREEIWSLSLQKISYLSRS